MTLFFLLACHFWKWPKFVLGLPFWKFFGKKSGKRCQFHFLPWVLETHGMPLNMMLKDIWASFHFAHNKLLLVLNILYYLEFTSYIVFLLIVNPLHVVLLPQKSPRVRKNIFKLPDITYILLTLAAIRCYWHGLLGCSLIHDELVTSLGNLIKMQKQKNCKARNKLGVVI